MRFVVPNRSRRAAAFLWGAILPVAAMAQTAQTIRVVAYNTQGDVGTNGDSGPTPTEVIPNVATAFEGIGEENYVGDNLQQLPDVIALEETTSNGTTVAPLVNTLNTFYGSNIYNYSTVQGAQSGANTNGNGPNALIYNQTTMNLVSSVGVGTPEGATNGEYRQVMRYELQPLADSGTNNGVFYVYVCHAKSLASGSITTDQQDQQEEATIIRNDEATLPANSAVMYVGDWNVDASTDPSMVEMSSAGQGQAFDPLNPTWASEDWAENSSYQGILTESDTDLRYRDDLELVTSNILNDGPGSPDYLSGSDHGFANNGTTAEGKSINQASNTALNDLPANPNPTRSQILDAMNSSIGSDHLPIVADYSLLLGATWSATVGGSWTTASNWAVSSIASQAGVSANFINSISAPATVTLDAPWTIGAVNINSTNAYTFAPGSAGSLILSGPSAAINVFSGSHIISAPLTLATSTTLDIAPSTSTLTISGNIRGTGGLTLTGSGTVTLSGSNSFTGPTTVSAGRLNITAAGALAEGALTIGSTGSVQLANNVGINPVSSLTITGGKLDISNNVILTSDSTASEATIQQYIENAEIISSFVNTNSSFGVAYADGSDPGLNDPNLTPHEIVIEPDLLGDTDLNGTVNIHDLQTLLSNFNSPGFWDDGNFNGHANADISDLTALLTNFNNATALSYSELSGIENLVGEFGFSAIPNSNGNGFTLTAIPEPVPFALGLLASSAFLLRRRRITPIPAKYRVLAPHNPNSH
jgi:autotransporter-associated beta strand protein